MEIQIIQDNTGKNAGVFISYDEWEQIKKQHKELKVLEQSAVTVTNKEKILKNLKKGLKEVYLFKQVKLKTTSAKDFLNEL